jgi:(p)ppGpp synthase/HD superfamily hydrolase
VKKAMTSPKLKHEHTYHKLTAKFLTETNIKRLIAVRNKNKIVRNQMKNDRIKCTESKREKKIYSAFPDHVDVQ